MVEAEPDAMMSREEIAAFLPSLKKLRNGWWVKLKSKRRRLLSNLRHTLAASKHAWYVGPFFQNSLSGTLDQLIHDSNISFSAA